LRKTFSLKIADLNFTLKNISSVELKKALLLFSFTVHYRVTSLNLNLSYFPLKRKKLPLSVQKKERKVFQIKRNDFFAEIDFARLQGEVKISKN